MPSNDWPGRVSVVNIISPARRVGSVGLNIRLPSRARIRTWLACSWNGCSQRPVPITPTTCGSWRSEEHTSELQSQSNLVCRLLLEKKKKKKHKTIQSGRALTAKPAVPDHRVSPRQEFSGSRCRPLRRIYYCGCHSDNTTRRRSVDL